MSTAREKMQARQAKLKAEKNKKNKLKSELTEKQKQAKKKSALKRKIEKDIAKKDKQNQYKILEERFIDLHSRFIKFQQSTADQIANIMSNQNEQTPISSITLPYTEMELANFITSFDDIYEVSLNRYIANGSTGKVNSMSILKRFVDNLRS